MNSGWTGLSRDAGFCNTGLGCEPGLQYTADGLNCETSLTCGTGLNCKSGLNCGSGLSCATGICKTGVLNCKTGLICKAGLICETAPNRVCETGHVCVWMRSRELN